MKFYFLFIVSIISSSLFAQERSYRDDTIQVKLSYNRADLTFQDLEYYNLDGLQNYRPFGNYRLPLSRSGNIGLPVHSYFLDVQDWNINHNIGGYQPWLMEKDSLKFYQVSRPYTELRYFNGAKREQLFQLVHTQNFGKGLNIGLNYQRIVSDGYYSNQLTNHKQFNSTYNLRSKNQRFNSRGYFLINSIESLENGGLKVSDDNAENDNTVLLEVGLQRAQNISRSFGLGFYNKYNINKKDSVKGLSLSHEIEWSKSYRNYSDTTTTFYENYFFNDQQTADSSFSQVLANTLLLNLFDDLISIGAKNEQYHYFQNFFIDENFESNYFLIALRDSLFGQKVEVEFEKGLSGYNKDELDIAAAIYFEEWQGIKTRLKSSISKKQPDYFLQNQRTNHYSYSNRFKTSNQSAISLVSKIEKLNLSFEAGIQEYENFIYYDTTQLPKQLEETFTNLFLKIDFRLEFLRHMNLKNIILFQNIGRNDVAPLPAFTSYHTLYYENSIIREALGFQIGTDLRIIGSYSGYNYSPALTQFYLNESSSMLGDIYQVDFFLNMRINRSARIMFKMENIFGESFSEESFRIHGYSIPGKSFKVGLTWRMIN